jgi:uncharacterized membrane protein YjfL (UPF0719 family)
MLYGVQSVISLLLCFALCWVGKRAIRIFHPRVRVDLELTAKDNVAFAVPLGAYYLGILIVLGGPLSGESSGSLVRDAGLLIAWGLLAVVLLNLAALAADRFLFPRIDLHAEIVQGQNLAAGILVAGFHLSSALLVLGALSGEGGLLPAAVFWLFAQCLLILAAAAFLHLVGWDVTAEIQKGNRALALSVAGVLVAMGNILRMAISGSFEGWGNGFAAATGYALAGLAILFVARWLTDWLLLPGVTIRHEVLEQEVPNVGVGYLEALFYLGLSILIGWTL